MRINEFKNIIVEILEGIINDQLRHCETDICSNSIFLTCHNGTRCFLLIHESEFHNSSEGKQVNIAIDDLYNH